MRLNFHEKRFTVLDDYNWFTKTATRVASEELSESIGQIVDQSNVLWVDFNR